MSWPSSDDFAVDVSVGPLSPAHPHAFRFRGVDCASMWSLLTATTQSDRALQARICQMDQPTTAATRLFSSREWQKTQVLWWMGMPMNRAYSRSGLWGAFLSEAYDRLFRCSPKGFAQALRDTGNADLVCSGGDNNPAISVLTGDELVWHLSALRTRFRPGGSSFIPL